MYVLNFFKLLCSFSEQELTFCYSNTTNKTLQLILQAYQKGMTEQALAELFQLHRIGQEEVQELQDLLLEQVSLSVNSPYVQVVSNLRKCNWLFNRQQFSLCKEYLERVKQKALQYDYFEMLVTITAIEMNLQKRGIPISSAFPAADAVAYNRLAINYRHYIAFQYTLEEQRTLVDGSTVRRLAHLLEHELLQDIAKARSTSAKIIFHETKGKLYYLLENYEAAFQAVKALLQLYEQNTHLLAIPAHRSKYISVVGNYFGHSRILGVQKDRLLELRKLQKIAFSHEQDHKGQLALNIFVINFLEEIQAYLNQGDYTKIIDLIPDIEAAFGYQTHWSYKCVAYRYFAYAYFLLNNYQASLHWIDLLLIKNANIVQADVKAIMYQVKLIIYFEEKRWKELTKLIEETESFYKQCNRRARFEQLFINFMHALTKHKTKPEIIYNEYLPLFKAIETESEIRHREEYFDIESWIEEKLISGLLPC